MVTKSSREMQKDREKIRPSFGGLKFCQGTHYLQHTLFQIGEPVIKYKESGSIMDWIKYIKENKRKRK